MLTTKKIPWKEIAIVGGVFVLYKAYELYRTGTELIIGFKKVKFSKLNVNPQGKIDSANMKLTLSLFNISPGSLSLRGLDIKISVGGLLLAKVARGRFDIKRGENLVEFDITLMGKEAFDVLGKVFLGEYPSFDVQTIVRIPFFSYKHEMKIPTSDYMTDEVKNALTFIR